MRRTAIKRSALKRKPVVFACVDCSQQVERAKRGAGLCRPCAQTRNLAGRTYTRSGETRVCEMCGSSWYVSPSEIARGVRYCSGACRGASQRKDYACVRCGSTYQNTRPGKPRKTCSPACETSLRRAVKTGRRNPRSIPGTTTYAVWYASAGSACCACGAKEFRLHLHHVVYEQHVRACGGDVRAVANGLTVCIFCHSRHHAGAEGRLSVSVLRSENLAFASELLGPGAYDYFHRYYAVTDDDEVRLAPLLEVVS